MKVKFSITTLEAGKAALVVGRTACYLTAGYLLGRKAIQVTAGISCKAASQVAKILDEKETSTKLNNYGDRYLSVAKTNLVRDVVGSTVLLASGLVMEQAEDSLSLQIDDVKADSPITGEFLSDSWEGLKNRAINAKRWAMGDERYLPERIKDFVIDGAQNAKNFFYNDFRLTPPEGRSFYQNEFGLCGPKCQEYRLEQGRLAEQRIYESISQGWKSASKGASQAGKRISESISYRWASISQGWKSASEGASQAGTWVSETVSEAWKSVTENEQAIYPTHSEVTQP